MRGVPDDPERVKEVKRLIYEEKLTYTQAGDRLGISRGSIANIVRRWIKMIPDDRIRVPKPKPTLPEGIILLLPPASPSMLALAEFDPVIARALRHRRALTEPEEKGAEAP